MLGFFIFFFSHEIADLFRILSLNVPFVSFATFLFATFSLIQLSKISSFLYTDNFAFPSSDNTLILCQYLEYNILPKILVNKYRVYSWKKSATAKLSTNMLFFFKSSTFTFWHVKMPKTWHLIVNNLIAYLHLKILGCHLHYINKLKGMLLLFFQKEQDMLRSSIWFKIWMNHLLVCAIFLVWSWWYISSYDS